MKRRSIITIALLCVTLCVPLTVFGQSQDFQMNGTVLVKYNGNAANVIIPEGVTAIGYRAFTDCISIINITIPLSVIYIENMAFEGCNSLENINVNNRNSTYSSVDGVLFNKDRTVLVKYPEGRRATDYTIPEGVASIENFAFSNCINLVSINIPSSVTYVGYAPFGDCSNLESIIVNNRNSTYSSVDGVLFDNKSMMLVKYPEGKYILNYIIPENIIIIDDFAFYRCTDLTNITIPSSVTFIGNGAFSTCTSLTSVTIPSSVTYIGFYSFYKCNNLRTVTLSRKTTVGENAFPSTALIVYSD